MAMLFVGLGSAAASSVAEPVDLVLAVKEGDSVAWAQKYAGRARVIAYNKGQQALGLSSVSEVALPNVGREAHAYLHHIVHRFDSLAAKTVFMPGGLPTSGFHGFAQSGGSLLPGATLEDYLSSDSAELMVPTMALSKDLKQFSVRMSLMDNKTETNVEGGKRFGVCSADGSAGWSPFLPNKFASSVLEPLMTQQHAQWDFPSFWARYMPTVPLPERVLAAHGAVFSVSRENIRSHPKHFYEGLLKELEGTKDPYQSFFLEHMWWYVFHSATAAPCEADFAPKGDLLASKVDFTRAAASRKLDHAAGHDAVAVPQKRKLGNVYTLVQPHQGQQVDFGSTINVQWSVNNDGYQRVELWRYGSFVTRIYNSMHGYANTVKEINWHVEPGPQADSADMTPAPPKLKKVLPVMNGEEVCEGPKDDFPAGFGPEECALLPCCAYDANADSILNGDAPGACVSAVGNDPCPFPQEDDDDYEPESFPTKTYGALQAGGQIESGSPTNAWLQFFKNFQPGDKYTVRVCSYSENEDEEICDDTYGESGEFNINAVVRMLSPVQANTYTPGDFIPITWQSYFVSGNKVNIKIKTENHVVWKKDAVDDTGAYTFYVPPDMKAGLYTIEVVGMEPDPADGCDDDPTFMDWKGQSCASWNTADTNAKGMAAGATFCETSRVTSCGSHPPLVSTLVSKKKNAVFVNGTKTANKTAAVYNTTGGNPWAASVASYPAGGGLGSAGFATLAGFLPGQMAPSPGIYGVQCTVDDLHVSGHYMGSGGLTDATSGNTTAILAALTKGNDNAAKIRDACPKACGTCPQSFSTPYVGSCQSSTCQTLFTMGSNAPPPAPAYSTPSAVQWEVPIIQAFKGSFGLDEIKHGPGPFGTTISSTSTVSGGGTSNYEHTGDGTHPGGLNCDYVCHVYAQSNGIVGGRRLLFGGLQSFDQVDTNTFVGCSQDMRDCGCCEDDVPRPVPFVP